LRAYKWALEDRNHTPKYIQLMIEDEKVHRLSIGMDVTIAIDLAEHRIGWNRIIGNSLKQQFALLNRGVAASMITEHLNGILPKLVAAHKAGCSRKEFNTIMTLPLTPMQMEHGVDSTSTQEKLSFMLKHDVASKNFFLNKAQSDKQESLGVIERLTSSLTAAISSMETATEGGEDYARAQQRIVSYIRQITSEDEWSRELDMIIANNTEVQESSVKQLKCEQNNICLDHIHNEARATLERKSVSALHTVPLKFANLYWFRRWLSRYSRRLLRNERSTSINIRKDGGGYSGSIVTTVEDLIKDVVEKTSYRFRQKRIPEPNHIAGLHPVLRRIDTYYQGDDVCHACNRSSPLSAR